MTSATTPAASRGLVHRLRQDYLEEHGPAMTVALAATLGDSNPVARDYERLRWDFVEPPAGEIGDDGPRLAGIPARAAHLHVRTDFHGAEVEGAAWPDGYHFWVRTTTGLVAFTDLASLGVALRGATVPQPRPPTM